MSRSTITISRTGIHWGAGQILSPQSVDNLVLQHNEHAAALDTLEAQLAPQAITGTTDSEKITSIIAALVALGLATDETT